MAIDRRRAEHSDLTPIERQERARGAAHARWDNDPYGRTAATSSARDAFMQRFLDQADPEGRLDPAEREKRAAKLRSRYFRHLARKRGEDRSDE